MTISIVKDKHDDTFDFWSDVDTGVRTLVAQDIDEVKMALRHYANDAHKHLYMRAAKDRIDGGHSVIQIAKRKQAALYVGHPHRINYVCTVDSKGELIRTVESFLGML